MYVRPQFRGSGFAKLILNRLADHARAHGVSLLRLETGIHQREAIGLYEGLGFRRILPFGAYKPDLEHFRAFRERSGVAAGDWVHAACSWIHDVLPAARMGVPCVWVDRDRSGHPPALAAEVLPDMTGLPEAVERASSR